MAVSIDDIKKLREVTGAGILDVRKALEDANNDFEKAKDVLREKGLATARKRAGRTASEGVVELYAHGGGRVGVMVEVNCETDFVGRSEAFRSFAHEIALQIAASAPLYISEEEISEATLQRESDIAAAKAKTEGKPEKIIPRIVEGYIKKYKEDTVLLNQAYIRNDSLTVQKLLNETIASLGENVIIRRFSRYELGEESESPVSEDE